MEFHPPTFAKGNAKKGKTSQADLKEIHWRIPDLTRAMQPEELTSFEQIVFGDWLIWRDVCRDFSTEPVDVVPCLLSPQVVHQFHAADSAEVKAQAKEIMAGHFKKHAVLGVPISDGYHWTLLVLRRSGSSDIESKECVKIVYYDSLKLPSSKCKEIAQKILDFFVKDAQIPQSSCRTYQEDKYSCGQFLLHYWEGEVRQFLGQGWCVGRPFKKVVQKIRQRMITISREVEEFIGKEAGKPKKKEAKVAAVQEGPQLPAAEDALKFLEAQAKASGKAALQIFYGCSKCRHSRGGCIYYKCNPTKFEAHRAKFPWKYEGKEIKVDKWSTASEKELEGEF